MAAGFDVVGVDSEDHSRSYPGAFVLGDACDPPVRVEDAALVWASPPCQRWSAIPKEKAERWPDHIAATRCVLSRARRSVIENILGAPIRRDIVLSGPCMGLRRIERRRKFEVRGFWVWQPDLPRIERAPLELITVAGKLCNADKSKKDRYGYYARKKAGLPGAIPKAEAEAAMGLAGEGLTLKELVNAVPPAYAEFFGRAAMADIRREAAA